MRGFVRGYGWLWFSSRRRSSLDVGGRGDRTDAERPLEFSCCALLSLSLFGLLASITPSVQHERVFAPIRANSNPLFTPRTILLPPSSLGLVNRGVDVVHRSLVVRRLPFRRVVDKNRRRHEGAAAKVAVGEKEESVYISTRPLNHGQCTSG